MWLRAIQRGVVNDGIAPIIEIAEALGETPRWIRKRAVREEWPHKTTPGLGQAGVKRVYPIESLPLDVQAKVLLARQSECEASPDLDLGKAKTSLNLWDRADEQARRKARARKEILEALETFIVEKKRTEATEKFLCRYRLRDLFLGISEETYQVVSSISSASLNRWKLHYESLGLPGLLDKGKPGRTKKALTRPMQDFIIGLLIHTPHQRAERTHDYGKAKFGDLWPSSRTVRRFVKYLKHEKKDTLLFLRNPDKWRSKNQVAFGNASEKAKYFGHIIEFDATSGEVDFAGKRYNFTFAIDVFSRKLKALLSPTGNSMVLCNLLRQVILDWGIPDTVLVDNGPEFISHHFKAVCEALGIHIIYAQKFTPEDKGFVERVIWSVELMFFEEMAQYLGHNVAERKDIEARRSFAQRILKKGSVVECVLSPFEFQKIMNAWIKRIYHQRVHRGLGMSPEAKAAQSPRPIRKIADPRVLDILLAPCGERTIQKKGILFENGNYIALELTEHIGERVNVRHDLTDIGRLYVFDLQGQFICIARDTSLEGATLPEAREAKKRQKAHLREEVRALKVLANAVGDPMIDLIESKRNAPGQVHALHQEEEFENEAIREAAKAVEERMRREGEEKEQINQEVAWGEDVLSCFDNFESEKTEEDEDVLSSWLNKLEAERASKSREEVDGPLPLMIGRNV